eukprot:210594-Chlamydomonas_euryale.AAC.1
MASQSYKWLAGQATRPDWSNMRAHWSHIQRSHNQYMFTTNDAVCALLQASMLIDRPGGMAPGLDQSAAAEHAD